MDKLRKKEEERRTVEKIIKNPAFQSFIRKRQEEAVINAMARFTFMSCGFLETRHGYKTEGLKRFLAFVKTSISCTEDDEHFFLEYANYYKEEYGLDVLGELGLAIEKEESEHGGE